MTNAREEGPHCIAEVGPVVDRRTVFIDLPSIAAGATVTQSGSQWIFRWAPGIDERAVDYMAEHLPDLFRQWQAERKMT